MSAAGIVGPLAEDHPQEAGRGPRRIQTNRSATGGTVGRGQASFGASASCYNFGLETNHGSGPGTWSRYGLTARSTPEWLATRGGCAKLGRRDTRPPTRARTRASTQMSWDQPHGRGRSLVAAVACWDWVGLGETSSDAKDYGDRLRHGERPWRRLAAADHFQ